jgi:Cu(I)/Ag(I) efflux system membrane fusion protein
MPGMVLYEIADLSAVWVEFDALEGDVAGVGVGSAVSYTVDAIPGQSFRGAVSFVSPTVDAMSRRITLRLEVSNPSGKLKPDMLVRGQLRTKGGSGLRVPASAVLWTGPRSVVYVKLDGESPTFQLREVTLGGKSGDTYLITSGLEAGERVVVNGAFTVDAEFQLAGKASMMNRPETASASTVDNTDLKPLVDAYLPLKDALLASDAAKAVAAAKGMLAVAEAQPLRDARWNALRTEVIGQLRGWEREPGLDAQRTRFRKLSDTMRSGLDAFGAGRPIAVQFCPMAFNNSGARWLSASETIENPYLPETMLGCGEVLRKL